MDTIRGRRSFDGHLASLWAWQALTSRMRDEAEPMLTLLALAHETDMSRTTSGYVWRLIRHNGRSASTTASDLRRLDDLGYCISCKSKTRRQTIYRLATPEPVWQQIGRRNEDREDERWSTGSKRPRSAAAEPCSTGCAPASRSPAGRRVRRSRTSAPAAR